MTEKEYADLNLDTLCVMIVLLVQTLMGVAFLTLTLTLTPNPNP